MRIAVIGSGIAGLGAAWLLSRGGHQVVLHESQSRIGGHTHTHRVQVAGREYAVDTGFIVFNPDHYPLLTRLFAELGVASRPTTMSFSAHEQASGLQYNAGSLPGLFCAPGNLVSPRIWRMLADIRRFYREAPALLASDDPGPDLGSWLTEGGYSTDFAELHLVPMASALWSSPRRDVLAFPARYLVQFMANHCMLQMTGRPSWRVVEGGSSRYIDRLVAGWNVEVRCGQAVEHVRRGADAVEVTVAGETHRYEQVVLATHGDEALALLADPSPAEADVLGAFRFQHNQTVLHTDASVLPPRRRAWAAWNAHVPAAAGEACTVSYWMNLLQGIDCPEPLIVSLNRSHDIDPGKVLARMDYSHPMYSHAMVAAQSRRWEISGHNRTWYCGAWWGFGFHEDGLRSAVEVAKRLGVSWPPR